MIQPLTSEQLETYNNAVYWAGDVWDCHYLLEYIPSEPVFYTARYNNTLGYSDPANGPGGTWGINYNVVASGQTIEVVDTIFHEAAHMFGMNETDATYMGHYCADNW